MRSHSKGSKTWLFAKASSSSIHNVTGTCAVGEQGVRLHPPIWANYFKIMQFFTRNRVYTPNFRLKIGIFLRFATPYLKVCIWASVREQWRLWQDRADAWACLSHRCSLCHKYPFLMSQNLQKEGPELPSYLFFISADTCSKVLFLVSGTNENINNTDIAQIMLKRINVQDTPRPSEI